MPVCRLGRGLAPSVASPAASRPTGTPQNQGKLMRKFIIAGMAVAMLAVPTASMASQPADPGGFGRDRAAWIHANSGAEWGAIAGDRAGDNGTINNDYKDQNSDLPVESTSAVTYAENAPRARVRTGFASPSSPDHSTQPAAFSAYVFKFRGSPED